MSDAAKQFTITRTFDAPRDEVWRAWTDSSVATQWWHPAGLETRAGSVTIDLREGGAYAYTMVDPDGTEYPCAGSYLEVRPLERLRFTWGAAGDRSQHTIVTVDLVDADDGRTAMTFHVDGVGGRPGDGDVYDGWDQAFDLLDRIAR